MLPACGTRLLKVLPDGRLLVVPLPQLQPYSTTSTPEAEVSASWQTGAHYKHVYLDDDLPRSSCCWFCIGGCRG